MFLQSPRGAPKDIRKKWFFYFLIHFPPERSLVEHCNPTGVWPGTVSHLPLFTRAASPESLPWREGSDQRGSDWRDVRGLARTATARHFPLPRAATRERRAKVTQQGGQGTVTASPGLPRGHRAPSAPEALSPGHSPAGTGVARPGQGSASGPRAARSAWSSARTVLHPAGRARTALSAPLSAVSSLQFLRFFPCSAAR